MKKTLLFALALLLAVAVKAQGYGFSAVAPTGQTLYYRIVNGGAEVVPPNSSNEGYEWYGYPGPSGALTIPDSVTHNDTAYAVTQIGKHALYGCDSLTSVSIPSSVTTIREGAFYACYGLTSVAIPSSVTTIRDYAFSGCRSLTILTIPNSVDTIEWDAFSNIPLVYYHGSSPWSPWGALCVNGVIEDSLIYPDNTKTYLAGCHKQATSVSIPNSVTAIGPLAFSACHRLTSVSIPNSVTSIGESAFWWCDSLTSVTLLATITSIEASTFFRCASLTDITLPSSVTAIGNGAFSWCTSLTSINIPDAVTYIGEFVFKSCTSLTSITLPNAITTIEPSTFDCCRSLASVTIPNAVTSIGEDAFWDCRSLSSITIPDSVTSIGYDAFGSCTGLTSVTIGLSVDSIGRSAFRWCDSLATMRMRGATPPVLVDNYFTVPTTALIEVPCGSAEAYAEAWGEDYTFAEVFPHSITLETASSEGGTVVLLQEPTCADNTAVLQATPAEGYHFERWHDGVTDNPRTVTVTQDTAFTALFAPDQTDGTLPADSTPIRLYPNPATTSVTIEGYEGEVQVIDLTGKVVKRELITHNSQLITLEALPQGAYFVKMGEAVKKLIIK